MIALNENKLAWKLVSRLYKNNVSYPEETLLSLYGENVIERLRRAGAIEPGPQNDVAVCPVCGEVCEIHEDASGAQYIDCPECARVRTDPARRRTWRLNPAWLGRLRPASRQRTA